MSVSVPEVVTTAVQPETASWFAHVAEGAGHWGRVALEAICSAGAAIGSAFAAGWGAVSTFAVTHSTGLLVGGAIGIALSILGFAIIAHCTSASTPPPAEESRKDAQLV